jgi:small subunit ribosomal protein S16
MLMIRLQRVGRKHEPTFRVVLTDSKNGPKSGKYLENLGWYDTRRKNTTDQLDVEQIKHWIGKGAKLSLTLHNFLVNQKVIEGKKLNALPRKSPVKKKEEAKKEGAAPTAKEESAKPAEAAPSQAPSQTAAPVKAESPATTPVPEAPGASASK